MTLFNTFGVWSKHKWLLEMVVFLYASIILSQCQCPLIFWDNPFDVCVTLLLLSFVSDENDERAESDTKRKRNKSMATQIAKKEIDLKFTICVCMYIYGRCVRVALIFLYSFGLWLVVILHKVLPLLFIILVFDFFFSSVIAIANHSSICGLWNKVFYGTTNHIEALSLLIESVFICNCFFYWLV